MFIDVSNAVRVELEGKLTPAYLRDLGPEITPADVAAFEQRLGYSLPASYREFLLRYNGGRPVVGGTVDLFYKLNGLNDWDRLALSGDHPWELPSHLLVIGSDAFGNELALDLSQSSVQVLFLDHEEYLDNYAPGVIADNFVDLLNSMTTVEEANRKFEEWYRAERARVVHGAFPEWFMAGASALGETVPDLPLRFRTLCLELFDTALPSDPTNPAPYLFLDVCALIRQSQKLVPPIRIQPVDDVVGRWMKRSSHEIGIDGCYHAIGAPTKWLPDREARGWMTRDQYFVYLTEAGISQTREQLLKYPPADPNPPGLWPPGR